MALEGEWRQLEQDAQASFFLCWDWIGSLLHAVPPEARPSLVRVRAQERTVALSLLGKSTVKRRGVIRSRAMHWNETGQATCDAITLEHNGLLAARGAEANATRAVLRSLAGRDDWDELFISGLTSETHAGWEAASTHAGLRHVVRWEHAYHYIDLEHIRSQPGAYLGSLSANTRQQIRRATKLYAARGPLLFERADSIEVARDWLRELTLLHQAHWSGRGHAGAFGSDFARRFHDGMLERGWPRGSIEISRIVAGPWVLGYLYNFRKGETLHNYQSAFAYEADAKLKPGLVCHALAAEDAGQRGLDRYDLLMGGGHYKKRLANAEGRMVWCVVQKRRLMLGLENAMRELLAAHRQRLEARKKPANGGDVSAEDRDPASPA